VKPGSSGVETKFAWLPGAGEPNLRRELLGLWIAKVGSAVMVMVLVVLLIWWWRGCGSGNVDGNSGGGLAYGYGPEFGHGGGCVCYCDIDGSLRDCSSGYDLDAGEVVSICGS
jgi:hypothetical protein